jgi:ABC-2 type transport system ATP-binding protein
MPDYILELENLSKRYGRIKAVDELYLKVEKGNIFGILGPNGSGKTTTLGVVLDVVNRTGGNFKWFGEEPTTAHRKRIGAILETPVFYPYLSGYKNLQLIAQIKEVPNEKIEPVIAKVNLADRQHDKFRTYSLGMKQRLAIAAALLCDPEVMILDEPTNGLDPQGIADIRQLIIQNGKEGKTIILASHLLDEVQKVCTHFAVLKNGKKLFQGSVEDINKGMNEVEIKSEDSRILELLKNFNGVKTVIQEGNTYTIKLNDGLSSTDINKYLFENGIVASHLVTLRKSLEKQFLEILEESE